MFICIFGGTIVKAGKDDAEAAWSANLEPDRPFDAGLHLLPVL